jgi:poly-gamma-glutamate synthesis protein (capsule biosynthesis protein)
MVDPSVQVVRVGGVDPLRRPAAYPLGPLRPGRVTTLTVVGDVMLGRGVAAASSARGDVGRPLRPMARRLASADVTVGNLESTLSQDGAPTQGGDSFAAPLAVRGALRDAGFDVLSLANNHLGDYGPVALADTVRLLRGGRLETFGAGRTVREAWAPAVVESDGVTLGFLGFNAIGETPAVSPGTPGAVRVSMPPRTGPLDETELGRFLAAVRRLDRRVDVVVVVPHWGTQYTNRPEPVQWQVARRLVRAGADIVVGGHPHWVQGAAMIGRSLVVQSLGNFVFDMDFMDQTMRGLVAELVLWDARLVGARFVPYRMDAEFVPRVDSHTAAEPTFDLFWEFSGLGASPR